MKTRLYTLLITLFSITSWLVAQGIDFPDSPSQAHIGGLELLIGAGGAITWKTLKNRMK